ncbi:MAG: DUF3307 domain-containing protein [Caldilineaceae bacterium]|nr:DUF3307 domain-containing protein [Caldilineaceae bacterium]
MSVVNPLGISPLQTTVLVWAVIIHLVADWPLQTEWMAANKSNLTHPAAWVHSGVHTGLLLLILTWPLALLVGVTHLLIDTRRPLHWWMVHVKRMPSTVPLYVDVELWMDQVFHIIVLAVVVLLFV